jgi:Fic family protein
VYRRFAEPLTDEMLFAWHRMLVQERPDLKHIGRYRTDEQPMQVYAPKVHFEAPPSLAVPREMEHFVDWFNRTAPTGAEPLPSLTRAGIAHLYFVSVHPFEDGNGRIARTIAEKALAQGLGQPTLVALAATILARHRCFGGASPPEPGHRARIPEAEALPAPHCRHWQ